MCSTPDDASSSKISNPRTSALLCRICGKPIPLETAKTDGDGKTIHEECCYASKIKLEIRTFDVQASTTRQITARRNLQNRIFGRSKADAGERAFVSAATDRHPTERSFARLTPTRHYDVAGRISSG
jgi:hypothetical protein